MRTSQMHKFLVFVLLPLLHCICIMCPCGAQGQVIQLDQNGRLLFTDGNSSVKLEDLAQLVALVSTQQATISSLSSTISSLNLNAGAPSVGPDCSRFNNGGSTLPVSGVYNNSAMYCEFTSPATSWTLLSTFEQPRGVSIAELNASVYNQYCAHAPIWIQGNSEGLPLSPDPVGDGKFHIRSQDWRSILQIGRQYQLRQRFFKGLGKTLVMDVAYTFRYNGYVLQDQTSNSFERIWPLSDRVVLFDSTGIPWDVKAETVSFFLPYTADVVGPVFNACDGFYHGVLPGNPACSVAAARLFGSAGIIGSQTDVNDAAGGWAPMFFNDYNGRDIVWVHQPPTQNGAVYGSTGGSGGPIFLSYWVNPI